MGACNSEMIEKNKLEYERLKSLYSMNDFEKTGITLGKGGYGEVYLVTHKAS